MSAQLDNQKVLTSVVAIPVSVLQVSNNYITLSIVDPVKPCQKVDVLLKLKNK